MKFLLFFLLTLYFSSLAHGWGRHDLITKFTIEGSALKKIELEAESIEKAAPDLLRRVIPKVHAWIDSFHRFHDKRFDWSPPEKPEKAFGKGLSAKEAFLWALDDNILAPLDFSVTPSDRIDAQRTPTFGATGLSSRGTAADVLTDFVQEPDAQLDNGLNRAPYLARLRKRMGLFYEDNSHTHAFRHYYVPRSWIPPLIRPVGVAPYQSALYAELAVAAFQAGHRYWGYRFLSWSIHYAQDVTQPWHTTLVPDLSFLSLSREAIRKNIAGFHYLTEAFSDSWLANNSRRQESTYASQNEHVAELWRNRSTDPWFIANLLEEAARVANAKASTLAAHSKPLFQPILSKLDSRLKPIEKIFSFGKVLFPLSVLDFNDDGRGATEFLKPIWDPAFAMTSARDRLLADVAEAVSWGVEISRMIILNTLERGGELNRRPTKESRIPALQSALFEAGTR